MRVCTLWPPHRSTAAPSSGCCSSAQQMRSCSCCSPLVIPRKMLLCLHWPESRWKTSWSSCEPSAMTKEHITAASQWAAAPWSCHCCFCVSSSYVTAALAIYTCVSFSASHLLIAVSSQALCVWQVLLPVSPGGCSRGHVQWHLSDLHHSIILTHCRDNYFLELESIFSWYFYNYHYTVIFSSEF